MNIKTIFLFGVKCSFALPTFFGAATKNLHVVIRSAADNELRLVPVAAEDPISVSGQVVEGRSVRSDVPHLDQRIVRAGNEEIAALRVATPVDASYPALQKEIKLFV